MITGFAHQATPLDAMRMGVRDYLDKNQDLDRDTLPRRRAPAARPHPPGQARTPAAPDAGRLPRGGREGAAAGAVRRGAQRPGAAARSGRSLFRFLLRTTGARDGVLLVRSYDAGPAAARRSCRVYDADGQPRATAGWCPSPAPSPAPPSASRSRA